MIYKACIFQKYIQYFIFTITKYRQDNCLFTSKIPKKLLLFIRKFTTGSNSDLRGLCLPRVATVVVMYNLYSESRSDRVRLFQWGEEREMETKEEPVGLCLPFEALVCMCLYVQCSFKYAIYIQIWIAFREMEPMGVCLPFVAMVCMCVCSYTLVFVLLQYTFRFGQCSQRQNKETTYGIMSAIWGVDLCQCAWLFLAVLVL